MPPVPVAHGAVENDAYGVAVSFCRGESVLGEIFSLILLGDL
jgi:hypothetical protein